MFIRIEPLGCDRILPAFVIGYELDATTPRNLAIASFAPAWFVALDQQAGGLAMSYPSVVGAVLRLDANRHYSQNDMAPLIAGLKAMAEDPDIASLRRSFPVLHQLVATHGEPYTPTELNTLETFLAEYIVLPHIENGIEAFIRFTICPPLDYFHGWHLMQCTPNSQMATHKPLYSDLQHMHVVDESNIATIDIDETMTFDTHILAQLQSLGQQLGYTARPRIFLLWENSD
jgi:hypothetical protein